MVWTLCILLHVIWFPVYINGNWIENKGLWYYISPVGQYVTYTQAIETCESMNSRLAVITNLDQNDVIENNMSGEEPRWIGLSNIKTPDHIANYQCNITDYVWNFDIFCQNDYDNFELQGLPKSPNCVGVTLKRNGKWTAEKCEKRAGFICQWECKRIYIQFLSLHEYNGIYELHHYWDEHIVYINTDSDNYIEISKVELNGKLQWELSNDTHSTVATYGSDSHVPYGEIMLWKMIDSNKDIDSGSFCIDCDSLSLCVDAENNENIHFNDMRLNQEELSYNTTDIYKSTALIQYNITQLTACVDVTLLNYENIHVCGYIFPYPDHTKIIDANNSYVLYIQNECVPTNNTCTPESMTTSSDGLPHTSQSSIVYISTDETETAFLLNPDDQKNIPVVIIGATIAGLAIITVVVLVLIFIVKRRRRRRHADDNKLQTQKYDNAKIETHIYSEMGVSGPNMTNKYSKGSVPNGAEYSYVDLPVRENKNIVTERHDAIISEKKNEPLNGKVDGFRAPDYGVLMTGNAHDAHNLPHGMNAIYSQVKKPKTQSAEATNAPTRIEAQNNIFPIALSDSINTVTNNYNDDLQLHENDLYMPTTDSNQQSEPQANHTYYNEKGIEDGYGRYALNPNIEVTQTKIPAAEATTTIVSPDNVHKVKYNSDNDLQLHENEVYVHTTENDQQSDSPANHTANHTYYNEENTHGIDKLNPNTAVTDSSVVDCAYYNIGDVKNDTGEGDLELFENSTYESSK